MKKAIGLITVLIFICSATLPSFNASATFPTDVELKCPNSILVNIDTDMVVFERNADEKCYPASLTKIMTAILAIEECPDLEATMITVDEKVIKDLRNSGSSYSGLKSGERLSMNDLLYHIMLPSGNDAALQVAYTLGGGDPKVFVEKMNQKAAELGMTGTNFMNPHGLHHDDHYTTPRDMYKLSLYAMKNPMFAEVAGTFRYIQYATNLSKQRTLENTNKLLDRRNYYGYTGTKGIKTGRTSQAGNCFAGMVVRNGYTYISVVMGGSFKDDKGRTIEANYAFQDTIRLYEWALKKLALKEIASPDQVVCDVPVTLAWGKESVSAAPSESFKTIIPAEVSPSSILIEPDVVDSVKAPVEKGQVLGTAKLIYSNKVIGEIKLVAVEDIPRSGLLHFMEIVTNIITSPVFIIVIIALVLLLVFVIINNYRRRKRAAMMRQRRNRY